MRRRLVLSWGMGVLLGACASSRDEPGPRVSAIAFGVLRALEGRWREAVDNPVETVEYWLTANDTVLVERWGLRSGRESMTLYHMDGRDLVAEHYCPQGNQPKLGLVEMQGGGYLFRLRGGANLETPDRAHQYEFWIAVDGPDSFRRSEVYVGNGEGAPLLGATADGATRYNRVLT